MTTSCFKTSSLLRKGMASAMPKSRREYRALAPEVCHWPSAAKEAAEKIGWAHDVAPASCRPVREFKQLPAGSRRYNKYCGTFSATCKAVVLELALGTVETVPFRRLKAGFVTAFNFRTYKQVLAALAVLIMLAAGAFARNPDPKAGMKVFWGKGCIRCHPVLGEGGNVGPDLSRSPSTADGLELAAAMWSHAPQMWQRMSQESLQLPTFQTEEMEDLFAFLAMARSFDEPGNAAAGMQLFQVKRCVECHSIRGKGGKVGPDLATVAYNRNPVAWVTAMWNHAPGMFRALATRSVQFPRFERSEMVDLESYIRSAAGAASSKQQIYLRPAAADQGAVLFKTKQCIRCHSIGTGAAGKLGPDLSRVALPRRFGEIAVVMWNHAPQMERLVAAQSIPYPNFEPQELADVLSYLNSLSLNRPGNPGAGAETFAAKGCSTCHATTSSGKGIGPNLTRLQQSLTPVSIARTMWNHGPAMLQRMEKSSIAWPAFNSKELADTLAYLQSIQVHPQQNSQLKTSAEEP